MKTFGERIKEVRIYKNLTQTQLGKILNVRNTTISAWEKDIAEPPYETLKKICVYFDVTSDYLLGLEDEDGHKETADYNFEYRHEDTKLIHRERKK